MIARYVVPVLAGVLMVYAAGFAAAWAQTGSIVAGSAAFKTALGGALGFATSAFAWKEGR